MFKKLIKIFTLIMFVFLGNNSLAISPQSEPQTIKALEFDSRFTPPQVQVYVNETIPKTEGCTNNHRYAFDYDSGGKGLFSLLLTARINAVPVRINVEGCQDGVPKIKIVRL